MATTMELFHEYAQLPAAEIKKVRFEDWRSKREVEEMLERRNSHGHTKKCEDDQMEAAM